jgi:hypothetical protein
MLRCFATWVASSSSVCVCVCVCVQCKLSISWHKLNTSFFHHIVSQFCLFEFLVYYNLLTVSQDIFRPFLNNPTVLRSASSAMVSKILAEFRRTGYLICWQYFTPTRNDNANRCAMVALRQMTFPPFLLISRSYDFTANYGSTEVLASSLAVCLLWLFAGTLRPFDQEANSR